MCKFIQKISEKLKKKLSNKKGQGMVEYAIIIAVVAIIAVAVFKGDAGLSGAITKAFENAIDQIDSATTSSSGEGEVVQGQG